MGVKSALLAIYNPDNGTDATTGADKAQAPDDVRGNLQSVIVSCNDALDKLNRLHTVLVAAGDTTNAATLATQITALS